MQARIAARPAAPAGQVLAARPALVPALLPAAAPGPGRVLWPIPAPRGRMVMPSDQPSDPTKPHRRLAASRIEWTNRVVTVLPKVPVTPRVIRRCDGSPARAWQIRAWADLASFTTT